MKKHSKRNHDGSDEPNHYKWGFLYFDPADHRVIVPKRIAWMGWTFNFASPFTYIIIILITGLIILLEYYFDI